MEGVKQAGGSEAVRRECGRKERVRDRADTVGRWRESGQGEGGCSIPSVFAGGTVITFAYMLLIPQMTQQRQCRNDSSQ